MAAENDIINAVAALGVFTSVSYIIAPAGPDDAPTPLPFFVLDGAVRDFLTNQTFCGPALVVNNYSAFVAATTAAEARTLSEQVRAALFGIANVVDSTDAYDEEGGFFSNILNLVA